MTRTASAPGRFSIRNPSTRFVVVIVLVALAAWFVLANTGSVMIRLWIPTVTAPLWAVLVGTFLVGAVVGFLMHRRGRNR